MSTTQSPPRWRDTPVRTLLVDLDGTLLASYDPLVRIEFIIRTLWRVRKHGGLRVAVRSLKAVTQALEHPQASERHLLNAERGARAFARETGLALEQADRVLRDEVGAVFPRLERYFFPVPGARDFIRWAQPRYRMILATNPVWPIEQVLLRLKWAGIDPGVFASITHSGRMHACKPSETYYSELLEQEGLAAHECALVGDDVRKDLPATRVGISVFILASGRKRPVAGTHEGRARAAFGSYRDLVSLLEKGGWT